MLNVDLAIKFGSNEIIIYRKGLGVIAKEPAYLAVVENGKRIKVKATGKKAEKLFLSKCSDVTVYQPIENCEIINEDMAVVLLGEIISRVIKDSFNLKSVKTIVAVPSSLSELQLYKLKNVMLESGVNKIIFVQNAVCARANLNLDPHAHNMVVDIGKYITDISVLNDLDFKFGRMCYIGGANMDSSITTFIMDNYNLEVSDLTSEAIKNEVASLYERDMYRTEFIGINSDNKFVKHEITANEVRMAILNVYDSILDMVKTVLDGLNKDVYEDINTNGIMFVGGGSKIDGLYEYAFKKLNVPIIIPESPEDAVILGAGKLLLQKDYLKIDF